MVHVLCDHYMYIQGEWRKGGKKILIPVNLIALVSKNLGA